MFVDSILNSSSNWPQQPPSMLKTVGEVQEVVVAVEVVLDKEIDEEVDQELEQPPFTLNSCSGLWVRKRRWA